MVERAGKLDRIPWKKAMPHCHPCWGKTNEAGHPSHHLAHHSMDVAAVLEALLCHPVLGARADAAAGSPLRTPEIGWLAAFAFLHDVGKLSPRFQADRKSTRLNSSHSGESRMPSSA